MTSRRKQARFAQTKESRKSKKDKTQTATRPLGAFQISGPKFQVLNFEFVWDLEF